MALNEAWPGWVIGEKLPSCGGKGVVGALVAEVWAGSRGGLAAELPVGEGSKRVEGEQALIGSGDQYVLGERQVAAIRAGSLGGVEVEQREPAA